MGFGVKQVRFPNRPPPRLHFIVGAHLRGKLRWMCRRISGCQIHLSQKSACIPGREVYDLHGYQYFFRDGDPCLLFDKCHAMVPENSSCKKPRAALAAALCGSPEGWVHWLGVQCSTWVATSRGSTGRSCLVPEGLFEEVQCVAAANLMVARPSYQNGHSLGVSELLPIAPARVAALCLATVAFKGSYVLEQPRSSLLHQHSRMQQLLSSFQAGQLLEQGVNGWAPLEKPLLAGLEGSHLDVALWRTDAKTDMLMEQQCISWPFSDTSFEEVGVPEKEGEARERSPTSEKV